MVNGGVIQKIKIKDFPLDSVQCVHKKTQRVCVKKPELVHIFGSGCFAFLRLLCSPLFIKKSRSTKLLLQAFKERTCCKIKSEQGGEQAGQPQVNQANPCYSSICSFGCSAFVKKHYYLYIFKKENKLKNKKNKKYII